MSTSRKRTLKSNDLSPSPSPSKKKSGVGIELHPSSGDAVSNSGSSSSSASSASSSTAATAPKQPRLSKKTDPAFVVTFYQPSTVLVPVLKCMAQHLDEVDFMVVDPEIKAAPTSYDHIWSYREKGKEGEGSNSKFSGLKVAQMNSTQCCVMFIYLTALVEINPWALLEKEEGIWMFRVKMKVLLDLVSALPKNGPLKFYRKLGSASICLRSELNDGTQNDAMISTVEPTDSESGREKEIAVDPIEYPFTVQINPNSLKSITALAKNNKIPTVRLRIYGHKKKSLTFFQMSIQSTLFSYQQTFSSTLEEDRGDTKMIIIKSADKQILCCSTLPTDVEQLYSESYRIDYFSNIMKSLENGNALTMRFAKASPTIISLPLGQDNCSFVAFLFMPDLEEENHQEPPLEGFADCPEI